MANTFKRDILIAINKERKNIADFIKESLMQSEYVLQVFKMSTHVHSLVAVVANMQ